MKIDNDKLFDELLKDDVSNNLTSKDIAEIVEEKIVSSLDKFKADFDAKLESIANSQGTETPDSIDDVNDNDVNDNDNDVNDESEVNENDEL